MKTYSIDEYVSNLVAQWKKSSNDGEPSEEAINAKVTEVGNKLAEDIDGDLDHAISSSLMLPRKGSSLITRSKHIERSKLSLKNRSLSATQSFSGPVDDSVIVARPEFDQPQELKRQSDLSSKPKRLRICPVFTFTPIMYRHGWME